MNCVSLKQRRDTARSQSGSYRGKALNVRPLLGASLWCGIMVTWLASPCLAEAEAPCECSRSGSEKMPACLSTVESSSTSSTTPQADGGLFGSGYGAWLTCPQSSFGGRSASLKSNGESDHATEEERKCVLKRLRGLLRNRCLQDLANRRLNTIKVRFERRISRWQRHSPQH